MSWRGDKPITVRWELPEAVPARLTEDINAMQAGKLPEQSLLILDISRGKAISLGQRFGQLAIVVGRRGQASALVPAAHPTAAPGAAAPPPS